MAKPFTGSCLCGAVRFEVDEFAGPFELCHCNRCRKLSGAAFMPAVGVLAKDFRFVAGQDRIKCFEAPILISPPAYNSWFCEVCGSPTPPASIEDAFLEVPAGLLDDDPLLRPDKHILIEHQARWHSITDSLPRFTGPEIQAFRAENPDD